MDSEGDNSMIVKELETAAGGERNESFLPDKITFQEHLQAHCRISYRMRKLKTKEAILVLMWSFMVMNVFYYLLNIVYWYHTLIQLLLVS